jgi:hypothetical protein
MKLSELTANSPVQQPEPPLPHPASSLADPPISLAEAQAAKTAICRWHRSQYGHLNVEGRVYFCPIGGQLWRHSKQQGGMYAPLRFK